MLLANAIGDFISNLTEWLEDVSGQWWFLLVIFAIALLDSVIPIVPYSAGADRPCAPRGVNLPRKTPRLPDGSYPPRKESPMKATVLALGVALAALAFVSPAHGFTTTSGRIAHFASCSCRYTGTLPKAWLHSTIVV